MDLRTHWTDVPGYLNAATMGLPPREVVEALAVDLEMWRSGQVTAGGYDNAVQRARQAFARIVGVSVADVAVGSQVSVLVGPVAASLPTGSRVVVPVGEFTSVSYPFMVHADRGVVVEHVPLADLADAVRPGVDVVAFSLAQSADGSVADVDSIVAAAHEVGAMTVVDLTQAVGWMPVDASRFDVTVTGTYKWLCAPRGSAFLTVRPQVVERIRPVLAGWYAGKNPWESVYGPQMTLADDASRFDVSPAWSVWVGTASALELFSAWSDDPVLAEVVAGHGAGLADLVRTELGLPAEHRPVLALPDPDGARRQALERAGCQVAGRSGLVRIAFHLWNGPDDVDRVVQGLRSGPGAWPKG